MSKFFPPLRRSALACAMFEVVEAKTDAQLARALSGALDIAGRGALATALDDIRTSTPFVRLMPGIALLSDVQPKTSGLTVFSETMERARTFVSQTLDAPMPVILVKVVSGPCDIYIQGGTDGFGLLHIGEADMDDKDMYSTLVHELTHAVILSGNLFLDEGLAITMEHVANGRLPTDFIMDDKSPDIRSILVTDWTGDPYFNALVNSGLSQPHETAAAFINVILSHSGASLADFAAFLAHEKMKMTSPSVVGLIKENFGISFEYLQQSRAGDIQDIAEIPVLAAKALALGDISAATTLLVRVRLLQKQATTGKISTLEANAAAAKVFLCLSLSQQTHANLYTGEAITAIMIVEQLSPECPEAYMFRAYKAVLEGQFSSSPIERNVANSQAAKLYETAVSTYPEHVEIVVATAKAQTYLPDILLAKKQSWPALLKRFENHPGMSGIIKTLLSHSLLKRRAPSC